MTTSLPEDLTADALFAWQEDMEANLERVLTDYTEEALSAIVDQAVDFSLTAASSRHLWERAVDRTLRDLGMGVDSLLREDLLEANVGDEAYTISLHFTANYQQFSTRIAWAQGLRKAFDIDSASLLAAGGFLESFSTWRTRIKRVVRTGFTGVLGRLVLAELRLRGKRTKVWVSKHDDKVRESHLEADGQTVPIDQSFHVGFVDLLYPGQRGQPLQETANCRCILVPGAN